MFGIGGMEFLIILVVGVVVLGPERLPKVLRTFTKLMSDFRRLSTDLQRTINTELSLDELSQPRAAKSKKTTSPKKKKKTTDKSRVTADQDTSGQDENKNAIPDIATESAADTVTENATAESTSVAVSVAATTNVAAQQTDTDTGANAKEESTGIQLDTAQKTASGEKA